MCSIFLPFSILTDSVVSSSHVIPRNNVGSCYCNVFYLPCLALEVHPVVPVLATHGETVLVVHVVGLPLVPALKAPWVTASPLPGALSCGQVSDMTPNIFLSSHRNSQLRPASSCLCSCHQLGKVRSVRYYQSKNGNSLVWSLVLMRSCSAWLEGWARKP